MPVDNVTTVLGCIYQKTLLTSFSWTKEYLQSLQECTKVELHSAQFANERHMVLNKRTMRGDWPLIYIVTMYPNDQGILCIGSLKEIEQLLKSLLKS